MIHPLMLFPRYGYAAKHWSILNYINMMIIQDSHLQMMEHQKLQLVLNGSHWFILVEFLLVWENVSGHLRCNWFELMLRNIWQLQRRKTIWLFEGEKEGFKIVKFVCLLKKAQNRRNLWHDVDLNDEWIGDESDWMDYVNVDEYLFRM